VIESDVAHDVLIFRNDRALAAVSKAVFCITNLVMPQLALISLHPVSADPIDL